MIHVPKEFVTSISLMRITPTWISNGHWCIKRVLVRNLADLRGYPDVEWREYEDRVIEDFLTKPANRRECGYEFTGFAKVRSDGIRDLLQYRELVGDKTVYLDRGYIDMARARGKGIDTAKLYSRNGETFYNEYKQFIVMGVHQ